MKKVTRRILTVILTLSMVFSLGFAAAAADNDPPGEANNVQTDVTVDGKIDKHGPVNGVINENAGIRPALWIDKSVLIAEDMISSVTPIGRTDKDGVARIVAVAIEYKDEVVSRGNEITTDMFTVRPAVSDRLAISCTITKAYINDVKELALEGKERGTFVILEVETEYLDEAPSSEAEAMAAAVSQTGDLSNLSGTTIYGDDTEILSPSTVIDGKIIAAQGSYIMLEDQKEPAFSDIGNCSANVQAYIERAAELGIVTGYSGDKAGMFGPYDNCTREQIMIMLWRAAGCPAPENAGAIDQFKDKNKIKSNGGKIAIAWAVEEGITLGFSDGTFRPQDTCTRQQVLIMLWRVAQKPESTHSIAGFTDVQNLGESAKKAIAWGIEKQITQGKLQADGTYKFNPMDECQRQHIAIFICRYLDTTCLP